ncbi:MAG: rod shape-determining protein MreC [Candidatus Omnitrophota bacterium]
MFKFKDKNIIYAVSAVVILVIISGTIPVIRAPVLDTLKHPFNIINFIRREVGGLIFFHRNLYQNEILKKEADILRFKLNSADEVYRENERLRNILAFKQKASYKVIVARVVAHPADSWSSAVIIDKGKFNGIRRGMVAITYLGLTGRVVEATEHTSKVMLINDPNIGVSAVVKRSRQEGLVSGTLGGYLIMRYLPKDSDIQISDVILTSGLTELYPKGLLIGRVVEVGEEFSRLSRYAVVKPVVDLSNIEEILIIIK